MILDIGSTAGIRELNQELILAVLRKRGSVSIAELARHSNLSIATCVKIVGDLLAAGEIGELEERESGGGRPARRYRFNPGHSLIAALILKNTTTGQRILHFIADATGSVIDSGVTDVAQLDTDVIDVLLDRLKANYPSLKAVSLSIPGMVADGVVGTGDAPCLTGVHLYAHIQVRHGLMPSIENDMNFAAMGYYKYHAGVGHSGLAYFLFPRGYNIGGGLVINDHLVRGKSGFSGELSYMSVVAGREELRRLFAKPEKNRECMECMAKTIIAATVLVNPGMVVLSGDDMRDDMQEPILELCLRSLPAEHLPEIVIKKDYSEDCLAGMIVLALSSLTRFPHLLEFPLADVSLGTA